MQKIWHLLLVLGFVSSGSMGQEVETRTLNGGNLILEGIPPLSQTLPDELRRYQNSRYAFLQDWSRDGQSLYIETRFGDVPQLHHIQQPGGACLLYTSDAADD